MKIKCNYCGSMFNDTLEKCPNCGAPNEGVVRTAKSQPLTIEQLQGWYHDRGLPPYEKTRFFIGENYKGPKAFGIYKDDKGNCVVYKNKADGSRAIRYEGTDEAYAVNEIFMRLKQEIIEQKNAHAIKNGGGKSPSSWGGTKSYQNNSRQAPAYVGETRQRRSFWDWYANLGCFSGCLSLILAGLVFIFGIYGAGKLVFKIMDLPKAGYYYYDETYMYCTDWLDEIEENGYIIYDPDSDNWSEVQDRKTGPEELRKWKTAKNYYLGEDWDAGYGCPDFLKSQDYLDISHNNAVGIGYYDYGDEHYYHNATGRESGWYTYDPDNNWQPIDSSELPEELTHYYRAQDFYYTPDWDSDTQIGDFKDSDYYIPPSSSSSSDDDSWWSGGSDYDNDYDYDWDTDWDWNSNDTDWDSDW